MSLNQVDESFRFMAGLDKQQPRWATQFASQRDLQSLAEGNTTMEALRYGVARGLMVAVRAALEAGIVTLPVES